MTTTRLYIAEKREVAAAIAEAFCGKLTQPMQGAYHTQEGFVTWLSGHNNLVYVKRLIADATELVNAGDPDSEGQRLVDEVIEFTDATHLPCKRLLVNDNTPDAIRKANAKMEDNTKYRGLYLSALARAVCDQRGAITPSRRFPLVQGSDALLWGG